MTQSEAGERKRTLVAVRSAESAPGQYGPQWALIVAYPWMKAGRTAKAWIPRDEFGAAPEPGQYSCLVEKGSRWATDSPGDEDWMYNWRLIGGLEDAEPTDATPAAPKPIAPLPADRDPTRTSIERQTALKASVELAVAYISKTDDGGKPETPDYEFILRKAEQFYHWLSGSPEKPEEPRTEEERDFEALGMDDDEHHPADR